MKRTRTESEAKAENLSLLIIDDNRKVLHQLEKNFKKLPLSIFSAEDFAAARAEIAERDFDVIVAEEEISGESALDFYMSIQKGQPVKIIMADMVKKELAEAKLYHIIDDYITKPVSDFSIIRALKDCKRNL